MSRSRDWPSCWPGAHRPVDGGSGPVYEVRVRLDTMGPCARGSGPHARSMAYSIVITDEGWNLVSHPFDPPGRRGAPATTSRRQMVDAMLFLARTGCQWRCLPERFGSRGAVWQQWCRWRDNGVWARAMTLLAGHIRVTHSREALPSMVVIDVQTVRGGRAGPTFHEAGGRGGRTNGSKRTILIERLGLPIAARVDSARPADITAGRTLLRQVLPGMSRPAESARAWLEVACVGYMLGRV